MVKSTTLYILAVLVFTAAFVMAAIQPLNNLIGILCAAGILLFVWRIMRGDD